MIEYTVKVYDNGDKYWYLDGKLHRENEPAIEFVDGDKFWYLDGKQHREDGPAVEYADGTSIWFLDGIRYSEEEFLRKTQGCSGKTVEIGGVKYKLEINND